MQYARPRGWTKGEPVIKEDVGGVPTVRLAREENPATEARWLTFSNEAARDEWLKWWGGKGK